MAIPFLSEIDKLINERGSAKILQERIAFAKEQYAALEKERAASQSRVKDLETENLRLKLDCEQLKAQIKNLEERTHNDNLLTLKFGVYWDREGNVYCPKCKTPGLQVKWATHARQQVQALKCSCSTSPFVLLEDGEPINAPEAIKRMAKV